MSQYINGPNGVFELLIYLFDDGFFLLNYFLRNEFNGVVFLFKFLCIGKYVRLVDRYWYCFIHVIKIIEAKTSYFISGSAAFRWNSDEILSDHKNRNKFSSSQLWSVVPAAGSLNLTSPSHSASEWPPSAPITFVLNSFTEIKLPSWSQLFCVGGGCSWSF